MPARSNLFHAHGPAVMHRAAGHHVERLRLDVVTPALDSAMALRARVEEIAQVDFPGAIERVLNRIVPGNELVALDRIEIDLGVIASHALKAEAVAAFERALAEAIEAARAKAHAAPGPGARIVTGETAAAEALETYLVGGIARGPAGFDPVDAMGVLAERPDVLLAMLRRHAHDRCVLDRAALQLPERDLLTMLAPADAALILQYHQDLRRLYRHTPAPAPEPLLAHALRVLTLEYLLREAGSQFNRRAYVGHLLRGMAAELGLAFEALLALLGAALAETRRRRPISGSLPALLEELLAEQAAQSPEAATPRPTAPAIVPVEVDLDELIARLRAAMHDPPTLAALVRTMTPTHFAHVTHRLEPAHAMLILAHLDGLALMHRAAMLLALTDAGFAYQLRLLTLRYLLREGRSQFNRRSWTRRLLRGLAAIGGVSFGFLVEALGASLAVLRRRMPPGGSLPMAIAELVAELAPDATRADDGADSDRIAAIAARAQRHRDDPVALALLVAGLSHAGFARLVTQIAPAGAAAVLADVAALVARHRREPLALMAPAAWERALRLRTMRWLLRAPGAPFGLAAWRVYLQRTVAREAELAPGALEMLLERAVAKPDPAPAPAERDEPLVAAQPAAILARFRAAPAAERAGQLRHLARDPARLTRFAGAIGETDWAWLVTALAPDHGSAIAADLARLERRHAQTPLAACDAAGFRALIRTLALAALSDMAVFDRTRFRRRLRDGIAHHEGVSTAELGSWRTLFSGPELAPSAADPLATVEQFLRTGQPLAAGAGMAAAALAHPIGFAALLRRLTIAASGNAGTLIDRLLEWMLAEEAIAVLAPAAQGAAAAWASHLADQPAGTMADGWRRVLESLLRGEPLTVVGKQVPRGVVEDRRALLRQWVAHGTIAWWAPARLDARTLALAVSEMPLPALRALFSGVPPDAVARGLRRVVGLLAQPARDALLGRLMPAAPANPAIGPDAQAQAIRVATAAITGTSVDHAMLAEALAEAEHAPRASEPPPPVPDARARLLGWIAGTRSEPPAALERLLRLLAELADSAAPDLDSALTAGLARPEIRARWAAAMPLEIFARVIERLAPARARFLLELHAIFDAAWRSTVVPARRQDPALLHRLILDLLAGTPLPAPRDAATQLLDRLTRFAPGEAGRLRAEALRHARQSGHTHLLAAMRPVTIAAPASPSAPDSGATPDAGGDAPLYVANAGMVLFAPFLPRFLDRIGALSGDPPRVTGIEAASRAVHLLQYLVDRRRDAPESDLALNKLLAGLPLAAPIARAIPCGEADIALCDELTTALIRHWASIRNTSPAGLRETFLQRPGRLCHEEGRWTLTVDRRTVDVLLDQVPWSFRMILHNWMREPLHVEW